MSTFQGFEVLDFLLICASVLQYPHTIIFGKR